MKLKKLTALLLGVTMTVTMLAGCGGATTTDDSSTSSTTETTTESSDTAGDSTTEEAKTSYSEDEISDFTMFITMPGSEINDDNEIAQMIGEKWGVRIKETWLTGQTASEATGMLIASDEYPDYIDSDDMSLLVDAGALIRWMTILISIRNLKKNGSQKMNGKSSVSLMDISTGSILSEIRRVNLLQQHIMTKHSGFR